MAAKKYTLKQAARFLGIDYSDRIYSVREAAQRLGISDSHCRRLLETRKIKGKKLGHDWVVLSLDYKRKRKPTRRAER
jgi:excisionase family DNA binding protein